MEKTFAKIEARVRECMGRAMVPNEEDFNRLALDLFALQRAQNPAYARLCALHNSPAPGNWREIPAVPTLGFKELELTSLSAQERSRVFYSSGTTQQNRSRHFHSSQSIALYEESLKRWFDHCFTDEQQNRRWIVLTPPGAQSPHSSLAHMFSSLAERHPKVEFFGTFDASGSWILDFSRLIKTLQTVREPVAILGTAFLFMHLLEELERRESPLNLQDAWILETGGYKGRSREVSKPEFHRLIGAFLGVSRDRIFGEYGMSELSSQAYDCADGQFQFPPWARALMISPATGREAAPGEPGLIRVVDLANIWSVMAIQTEDIGIQHVDGFELRGRAARAEARGCSLMSAE